MASTVSCVCLTTWPQRRDMFAQALAAYAAQDLPAARRQLVVVNDGAPLAPAAAGVVVVNLPAGRSIGEKRTAGLRVARGDWVATWDDDDVALPWHLDRLVAAAEAAGAGHARCDAMYLCDRDLRVLGLLRDANLCTAVVRRAVAERVDGWPPTNFAEDFEHLIRIGLRRIRAVKVPLASYVHRRHGANVSAAVGKESVDRLVARAEPLDEARRAAVEARARGVAAGRVTLVAEPHA